MVSKKSKFGIGFLIGVAGAALAGLFLNSKEGKKLQKKLKDKITEEEIDKKVKKIFGKVTKESKSSYLKARKLLIETAIGFQENLESIDTKKYKKIIDSLVKSLSKTNEYSYEALKNLKSELAKDWIKITGLDSSKTKKTKSSSSKKSPKRKSK
ncbi:MAG: hypothetical protein ABH812_03015 [bacterium]